MKYFPLHNLINACCAGIANIADIIDGIAV